MATDATDKKIRHEERMRDFAATLNEKDRRRFAALEASERGPSTGEGDHLHRECFGLFDEDDRTGDRRVGLVAR